MRRIPCCEKMGVKKGPWSPEEDQILISYIERFGHENWRALPKQAGLLRCGKSCRLRWINYLRPDIKRGNFSDEEEKTIIKLHNLLGNRWSTIAANLPGRTDNEIKNYWHTHLKKRRPGDTFAAAAATPSGRKCATETRSGSMVNNGSRLCSNVDQNYGNYSHGSCSHDHGIGQVAQDHNNGLLNLRSYVGEDRFNGLQSQNGSQEFWFQLYMNSQ